MKIGLVDVDGHNFPNIALMKIAAWHKRQGDIVEFAKPLESYNILYYSKIFSFTKEPNWIIYADKIVRGGSGYNDYDTELPFQIEKICPDYSLYNCQHAYGFLTRGCIRNCWFCIVAKKEGNIRANQSIDEFIADKKTAILLDNNVLASSWGLRQLEVIIRLKIKVDFIQGLDARIIKENQEIAKLLSKVKWLKPLRLACDSINELDGLIKAVGFLRKYNVTPSRYMVYMLVTNDIHSAEIRANTMKKYNLDPFAQSYLPSSEKREVSRDQRMICRWINRKQIFKSTEWKDYMRSRKDYIKGLR